jgi:thiol:disulfide interchange protein DsbD
MQKDWHTYWINPAESGAPTKIKWDLPMGFTAGAIQWPYPHKIVVPPVTTYGYENEAWLLNEIHVPSTLKPGDKITIKARVDWLECSVECIPGRADVSISLPVSSQMRFDQSLSENFSNARMQLPIPPGDWKLTAAPLDHGFQIVMQPPNWFTGKLDRAEFYSSVPGVVEYAKAQTFRKIKNGNYVLDIPPSETDGNQITSLQGVIVADPGWRGGQSEKAMTIDLPLTGTPVKADNPNFFLPLLFAFLGGLLLNLMPCVLPVLSIKVLSFLNHAPTEQSSVKKQSFAFAFGVIASFWALAGLLLFLRAGGQQLGWGFQMQSPPFVFALVSLFLLLGLNLLGVLEVGTSLTQLGSVSSSQKGLSGSFLSGALTTLVATPCTAPFMGSAVGFALTQGGFSSVIIFLGVGFGMALPYLLLSHFPGLLKFLPRPGKWMETLRQFMAFPLLATVIWLAWVFANQTGTDGILRLLMGLLGIALAFWIPTKATKPKSNRN